MDMMNNTTNPESTNDATAPVPFPHRHYIWDGRELLEAELRDVLAYGKACTQAGFDQSIVPVIQTKQQVADALKVCNALTDVVGDDEQHPLFNMMDALMTAIGNWEDADPELQAFFNPAEHPAHARLAHNGSEHPPSELGDYTGPVEVEYHDGTKHTANVGAIVWHRVVAYQVPVISATKGD